MRYNVLLVNLIAFNRFTQSLKGAYIAWSKKLVRRFIGSMERVDPDKFTGIRESVKLGLVWQTEAFECRKNSFS